MNFKNIIAFVMVLTLGHNCFGEYTTGQLGPKEVIQAYARTQEILAYIESRNVQMREAVEEKVFEGENRKKSPKYAKLIQDAKKIEEPRKELARFYNFQDSDKMPSDLEAWVREKNQELKQRLLPEVKA